MPLARHLRHMMTPAERKLWWHLREAKFPNAHFRRQGTIDRHIVDFCCHTRKLVIEIDGEDHSKPRRATADARRTAFLNSRGYRVLRFWNNEVLGNIEGVMTVIHEALGRDTMSTPHP